MTYDAESIIDLEGLRLIQDAKVNVLVGGGLAKHGHRKWQRLSARELLLKGLGHLTQPGADEECGEHHAVNAATRFDMLAQWVLDSERRGCAIDSPAAVDGAILLLKYALQEMTLYDLTMQLQEALLSGE